MAYRLLILLLLTVTLAYLALARQIPLDPWSAQELVNSRTLPTLYGVLLAVILSLLLFRAAPSVRAPRHVGRAVALFAVAAAFVWAVPRVGLWMALAPMLVAALLVMGERRPVPVVTLSAAIPGLGWLVVERLLGIHVPGPGG